MLEAGTDSEPDRHSYAPKKPGAHSSLLLVSVLLTPLPHTKPPCRLSPDLTVNNLSLNSLSTYCSYLICDHWFTQLTPPPPFFKVFTNARDVAIFHGEYNIVRYSVSAPRTTFTEMTIVTSCGCMTMGNECRSLQRHTAGSRARIQTVSPDSKRRAFNIHRGSQGLCFPRCLRLTDT